MAVEAKFFVETVGILRLVEIFFINWIADCFPRYAWCAQSVFFRDVKFLVGLVGLLSLCN